MLALRNFLKKRKPHTNPTLCQEFAAESPQKKPNNGVPVITSYHAECEFQFEGGPDLETLANSCQKNPRHTDFIPIQDFLNEEKGYCSHKDIESAQTLSDRVVRVIANTVSAERPEVYPKSPIPFPYNQLKCQQRSLRYGTGYIVTIEDLKSHSKPCRCQPCRKSKNPKKKYHEIHVQTAAHVIYDDEEARDAVFECFYDSKDRTGVKLLYGISAKGLARYDVCTVICATHDDELMQRLAPGDYITNHHTLMPGRSHAIIISHPHGMSKYVTLGDFFPGPHKDKDFKYCPVVYRLPRSSCTLRADIPPPGKEISQEDPNYRYFELPGKSQWVFPKESYKESVTSLFNDGLKSDYFKLPAGAYIDIYGARTVSCPKDVEVDLSWWRFQWVYNISTCPGSSGAPIFTLEGGKGRYHLCHCGAENGFNISSTGLRHIDSQFSHINR